jgi:5-deoxy-glucuronate isomerase
VKYDEKSLLFRAQSEALDDHRANWVTPQAAGWKNLEAELLRLPRGASVERAAADDREGALVILGGTAKVSSNEGEWASIGRRRDVFDGLPWALYLPPGTRYTLEALTDLEVAWCTTPAARSLDARLVTPEEARVELRGGHANSRQINHIVWPGFGNEHLVVCEVYTPAGNWSSYPPHKHDEHRVEGGEVIEADLEEIYLYKFKQPGGWAMQRVYTDDGRIDSAVVARDADMVLVPEGYHPVSAGYGYDCYYLNFLAGSAQSLACVDDPAHAWVKESWTALDPRLPVVHAGQEPGRGTK